MKNQYTHWHVVLLCFIIISVGWSVALAQRIVDVPQGVGTLNEFIRKDTLASGARVDTNTIYRLQRGGFYLTDASIANTFPLTIVAAPGSGPRPKIYPAVITGGISNRVFQPRANLTLRGLYVSNRDELGRLVQHMIRIEADRVRIVVDSCYFDQENEIAIRVNNGVDCKLYLTNSTFSNIGQADGSSNGRGIDDRGNRLDTVVVENCTWYNLNSRIMRDGGQIINYLRFNHNTVMNVIDNCIAPGQVGTMIFTNNLFVNVGFFGVLDTTTTFVKAIEADTIPGGTGFSRWRVTNNNFSTAQRIRDTLAAHKRRERFPYDKQMLDYFTVYPQYQNTMTGLPVTFTRGPSDPVEILSHYIRTNQAPGGPYWKGIPEPALHTDNLFDFSYSSSNPLYRASTMGQPLGDLRWFNMTIIPTSVTKDEGVIPGAYELLANYPNPFNPETSIKYALPTGGRVTLVVYNVLGQQIATLVNADQEAGSYTVRWNGVTDSGTKAASGVYLYQLRVGTFISTKKMVLAK